ncbi:hypothetical protein [Amycolatopsis halotolerans]|uniref:hypothetical protein n=1 Tax=Amycolatopsis halotolerans TaxID=330083 RepID=UPI00406BC4CA
MEPPAWAGEAPVCEHGVQRRYKTVVKKAGGVSHLFECVAVRYPDPRQCDASWINPPKKGTK